MTKHFLIFTLVVQKCGGRLHVSLLLVDYAGTLHQLVKNKTQIWSIIRNAVAGLGGYCPWFWNSAALDLPPTKLRRRSCHIHNYTEYNQQWICALHLTHPSAHTPGAVGSRRCGTRGAVGGSVPCSRVSPQSGTIPASAEIRTHNLGLQVQRSIH